MGRKLGGSLRFWWALILMKTITSCNNRKLICIITTASRLCTNSSDISHTTQAAQWNLFDSKVQCSASHHLYIMDDPWEISFYGLTGNTYTVTTNSGLT